MYRASMGHKFILMAADYGTYYLLAIPAYSGAFHKIEEAWRNHVLVNVDPKEFNVVENKEFNKCHAIHVQKTRY